MNDETNRDEELINQIAELYRPGKNQELLRQTIWDMVNHILDLDWLYDVIIQRAKEILDTPHIFLGLAEPDTDENKKRGIEFKKGIGLFNQKISEFDILAESILNDSSTSIIVSQERTSTIVQTMIGAPLKSG